MKPYNDTYASSSIMSASEVSISDCGGCELCLHKAREHECLTADEKKIISLIGNDIDGALEMARNNPSLLTICSRGNTVVNRLIPLSQNEHGSKYFGTLSRFYEEGLFTEKDISDKSLFHAFEWHCGWPADNILADFLISIIPKYRWFSFGSPFKPNMLHCVLYGHMDFDSRDKYFKVFYDMGVNVMHTYQIKSLGMKRVPSPFYLLSSSLRSFTLVQYIMESRKKDDIPLDFNEVDSDDGNNAMMTVLESFTKDNELIMDTVNLVKLYVSNGMHLQHHNNNMKNIYYFIEKYGWENLVTIKSPFEDFVCLPIPKFKGLLSNPTISKVINTLTTEDRSVMVSLITELEIYLQCHVFPNAVSKDSSFIDSTSQKLASLLEAIHSESSQMFTTIHSILWNNYKCCVGYLHLPIIRKISRTTSRIPYGF